MTNLTDNKEKGKSHSQSISMDELYQRISTLQPNDLILDVRSPEEFAQGHVPHAKNISHDILEKHISELKNYHRIYVHCQVGKRAEHAFQSLTKAGFENVILIKDSGMANWLRNGYPIEKQGNKH